MKEVISGLLRIPALLLAASALAQGGEPPQCPNRGCQLVAASEIVSSVINDCGQGISFQVGGITYTPDDNKCPAWIEFTPSHTESDQATFAPNKYTDNGTTFDILKQDYVCAGWGCGFLGLEGCCIADGEPVIVNTLFNCLELNCTQPDGGG